MAARRPPKVLASTQGAELVLTLPRGSVLIVPGDAAVEVRSGAVREVGAGTPASSATRLRVEQGGDASVQKALDALRAEPARRWTAGALAKLAGLSRTSFTRRFALATGRTPAALLAEERLRLARELLTDTDAKLVEIAARTGYANEFALSRAFKRHFGVAPSYFRRAFRSAPSTIRCAA